MNNGNIYPLDLDFQETAKAIAAYLVVGPEGPVLVETGPASTLGTLETRLSEHGFVAGDIHHVLVTHIHLDHAGAAGWWAQHGAQVYVHHVGAPHLIDPSKLLASAERIYGDRMDRLWGRTLPAPAENVHALYDGDSVNVCGLTFSALDTPGHARHHLVFQLGDVGFTGDAAAVRLPDNPFISLPAPPPEFDREAWQESLQRLLDSGLTTVYPTHFGAVHDVAKHVAMLSKLIDDATEFVHRRMKGGQERDVIAQDYVAWVRERAFSQGVTERSFETREVANPTLMSVDGIMRYWRKRDENRSDPAEPRA